MLVNGSRSKSSGGGLATRALKNSGAMQKRKRPGAVAPRAKQPDRAVQKRRALIDGELDRIYKQRGVLDKVMIVDVARDPKHPLHQCFEWDDTVAGEKYRQEQALEMIRASKYVELLKEARANSVTEVVTSHVEVRRYLRGRQDSGPAQFKMRNLVLSDADDHAATVEQFRSELRAWCARVVDIPELQVLRRMISAELDRA
jgi:hypothetical protein